MIQNMLRNDPNVSPMMGAHLEQLANNPALLEQVTQRMQDPAVRAQLQGMMGGADSGGGVPGMMAGLGGFGAGTGSTANASTAHNAPQRQGQGSDQDQTEDEMIAEAIRRSLDES